MTDKSPKLDVNDATLINSPASADEATVFNAMPQDVFLANTHLTIGSVIKDTFELVSLLGEGGMGTVFKALNKVWAEVEARDPYVAIKVLKPELSENRQLVRSLYSDFDRTKMLANCPNIIKVHGFDRDGAHFYMTMEYLQGKTLAELINHGAMSLVQAWPIIAGIGNALAYAHANNIVHRDIKPGNIIITHDHVVKVLDFGIASKINETKGDETKYGGHDLGALTEAYASPEMQRANPPPPDARDDIYAFACVIYEMLTGKQFCKQKILKVPPIQGLSSRQMDILNKSLAYERNQRTASITELLEKLRPIKKSGLIYAGLIGGLLLLVSGLMYWQKEALWTSKESGTEVKIIPVAKPQPASVTAPVTAPSKPELPPSFSATSSDGIVQMQTSKPTYKNGEAFGLSFLLAEPRYVRVIDRDLKGAQTTLRPNARQPDKLLPAHKDQLFPPKGFNVPVQGEPGDYSVTIIASAKPFGKNLKLLDADGGISEQVQKAGYSWVQVHYKLQ